MANPIKEIRQNDDPRLIKDFYERISQTESSFSFQGYEHNYVALLNPDN